MATKKKFIGAAAKILLQKTNEKKSVAGRKKLLMADSTLLLKKAKKDATFAALLWQQIADGDTSDEVALAWLRHIAPGVVRVVKAKGPNANKCEAIALRAVGLSGRINRYGAMFAFIDSMGKGERPMKARDLAQVGLNMGLINDVDGAMRAIEEYLRNNYPRNRRKKST